MGIDAFSEINYVSLFKGQVPETMRDVDKDKSGEGKKREKVKKEKKTLEKWQMV